jgi:hypothetical protein
MSSRAKALLCAVAMIAAVLTGVSVASASHNEADEHSKNFKQLTLKQIPLGKDAYAQGSDLAFKDDLVIAGTYEGTAIYKILKGAPYIKQVGWLPCAGGQGDVSVMGDYVIVSVDSALVGPTCKPADTAGASAATYASGGAWEGLRIIDISNPTRPKYVTSVDIPCGSHTNTLLPGKAKTYVYIESYPLSGQGVDCNYATHRKVQIVEIPNDNPRKAKLLEETIDVSPNIGCHDITTFPERKLMFGACINQSVIWSIKNPTQPEELARITNPRMQIHHSTAMTWDGKVLILGDETGGAAAGGGTGQESSPVGAAWFYDVTKPDSPTLLGSYSYPRGIPAPSPDRPDGWRWTNHNFNVIPMKNEKKYLLAVCYYMGGVAVVDFTDPSDAKELGYYVASPDDVPPDTWSSYWYNGRIYTNDHVSLHGVGVYEFEGTTSPKTTRFFGDGKFNPQGEVNPQVQIWSFK